MHIKTQDKYNADADGNPRSLHSLCVNEPAWAVSRIERLTADNAKLRAVVEAVKVLAQTIDAWADDAGGYDPQWFRVEEALAALEGQDDG